MVKELPHELVLVLPYQGAPDSSFAELFCELDQRLGKLGLAGFGIDPRGHGPAASLFTSEPPPLPSHSPRAPRDPVPLRLPRFPRGTF